MLLPKQHAGYRILRVKYAAQVFSNAVADGLKYLQEKELQAFQQCDGTIHFTRLMNDIFDALNRKLPHEGVRLDGKDFAVLEGALHFLDAWEKELDDGKISKDMFLTKSTSEGLRVTLHSTIGLCRYLYYMWIFLCFDKQIQPRSIRAVFRNHSPSRCTK